MSKTPLHFNLIVSSVFIIYRNRVLSQTNAVCSRLYVDWSSFGNLQGLTIRVNYFNKINQYTLFITEPSGFYLNNIHSIFWHNSWLKDPHF